MRLDRCLFSAGLDGRPLFVMTMTMMMYGRGCIQRGEEECAGDEKERENAVTSIPLDAHSGTSQDD